MKSNIKSKILASTLLAIGFLVGASALSALAGWTAAPGAPTNCPTTTDGCNAPIHVGGSAQTKLGPLTVNTNLVSPVDAWGLIVYGAIRMINLDGTTGAAGSVLTNVNGDGVGTWQVPVAGGAGSNCKIQGGVVRAIRDTPAVVTFANAFSSTPVVVASSMKSTGDTFVELISASSFSARSQVGSAPPAAADNWIQWIAFDPTSGCGVSGTSGTFFITPINVANLLGVTTPVTYTLPESIPVNAKAVILEGYIAHTNGSLPGPFSIGIDTGEGTSLYRLLTIYVTGNSSDVGIGGQGTFPILDRKFRYRLAPVSGGAGTAQFDASIKIIGYII